MFESDGEARRRRKEEGREEGGGGRRLLKWSQPKRETMLEQGLRHFGAGRGLSSPPPLPCLQAGSTDTSRPGQGAGR